MILKTLKVSNILSYKFLDNFDEATNTIEFKEELNILIGSNGSGKSNLLEIINKLFQGHFFEYYFINDNALYHNNQTEKVIKINQDRKNQVQNTLFKNFNNRDSLSHVQIGISPDKGDIENLLTIFKNLAELKGYSEKYCDNQIFLANYNGITEADIKKISSAKYTFQANNTQGLATIQFQLTAGTETIADKIFYHYLLYFNQLQTLLEVINLYEGKSWPLLKSPFALISSMRQYGGFATSFSVGTGLNEQVKSADQAEGSQSAKNYVGTDYIFRITNIKLGQFFRRLRDQYGADEAFKHIANSDNLLTKINTLLKENLGFKLKLENYNVGNDTIMLQIYNGSEVINFTELSMGQKSIFYLLFAVYGYDIQNGLLIIDEPELHLHVTMQKKYFSILKDIGKRVNIQILIATHSSIFIDENTIKNTFRFFKNGNETSIVCPAMVSQSQKDLIKILTYTNSSRIFFSDSVVLVEGDSDEYFFTFFYDNYIKRKFKSEATIEILYIGGKGNFPKWRKFLNLFKIKTFFIGDFDNVKEFGIIGKAGLDFKALTEKSKEQIISKFISEKVVSKVTKDGQELLRQIDLIIKKNFILEAEDKKNLETLWIYLIEKQGVKRSHIIDYLKEQANLVLFDKIKEEIVKLYSDGVFILMDGDLEEYLSISKDLTNVISFCQNDFAKWVAREEALEAASKVLELETIFQKIIQ
jgi:putative ATP-dependent endonuclease of OLD family